MTLVAFAASIGAILACTCQPDTALLEEFRVAKEAALASPAKASETWTPDAILHLSPTLTDTLLQQGIAGEGPWKQKVDVGGGVVLTPDVTLESAKLVSQPTCDQCMQADVKLTGDLRYKAGILGKGTVPLTVTGTLDLLLESTRQGKSWKVTAAFDKVQNVSIELAGVPKAISRLAEDPVRSWAEAELKGLKPIPLTELKATDLPVQAFAVKPEGAGIRIDLLTGAVQPGAVSQVLPKHTGDWQLDISTQSLVWLARTAAFDAGPQSALEVVAVPESLKVKREAFTLDVRLWRVGGVGWWRDYRITGKLGIRDGNAVLEAEEAKQLGASPGAGMADPLVLLAEGLIVDTIAMALDQSIPAAGSTTVEGWTADVDVTKVLGSADGTALLVTGDLDLKKGK